MPTVILVDVSLSMTRPVQLSENSETTRKQLAIQGINAFLDSLSIHSRLEFIALCYSAKELVEYLTLVKMPNNPEYSAVFSAPLIVLMGMQLMAAATYDH